MQQLAQVSGIPARTLREWIHFKLLPKPIGHGRGTRYDGQHLARALAVLALRQKREPIRNIRRQLEHLNEDQLRALAPPTPLTTDAQGVPLPPAEPTYPSRPFEVVVLTDGLTLLVSTDRGPLPRRIANEIYRHYGARV